MTEFLRPGPLGTTEHDRAGEFSKIRLNRPSHNFIGKGQAPVPLGTSYQDAELKRLSQRGPTRGGESMEADVRAILASYEQTVAHMVETKRRLPGSGPLTGWANNFQRDYVPVSKDSPLKLDCIEQAREVLIGLLKLGLGSRWELNLIGPPPHYKAQAVPVNGAWPLITMDPWVNRYEVRYPPYRASTEINFWLPPQ